jgi:hypothetical protein
MKHKSDRVSVAQERLRAKGKGRSSDRRHSAGLSHRQGPILEFDSPEANQLKSHGAI